LISCSKNIHVPSNASVIELPNKPENKYLHTVMFNPYHMSIVDMADTQLRAVATTTVSRPEPSNLTLQPSNLLNLCDDIQWKIGKEIKFKRIEEDAKKRKAFLGKYINMSRGARRPWHVHASKRVGWIVMFCNTSIKDNFEQEICDKYLEIVGQTKSQRKLYLYSAKNRAILAEILDAIYKQILFYIGDELKCRKLYNDVLNLCKTNCVDTDFSDSSDDDTDSSDSSDESDVDTDED